MKKGGVRLCVGLLLCLGVRYILLANPQLAMTIHESYKIMRFEETFSFPFCNGIQLLGKISPRFEFFDNGNSSFNPHIAMLFDLPPLGQIEMAYGDFTQDARMAPFFSTPFALSPLEDKELGKLKNIPLAIVENSSGSFSLSSKLWTHGVGHLCTWVPFTEKPGFGGVAAIIEWRCNSALMRGGILVTELMEEQESDWLIPYYALPISSGGVGYMSLNDKHTFAHPDITLKPALLFRFSYDRANGIGLSHCLKLEGAIGDFLWSFQHLSMHQQLGAVEKEAFTTIDAPLQSTEFNGSYHKRGYEIRVVVSDKWWRSTVYAALYQRRRLQCTGSVIIPLSDHILCVQARYEQRWNRSGTMGKSVVISTNATIKLGEVTLNCKPIITFGRRVSVNGEINLSKDLNAVDRLQIRWKQTSQVVKLSGVWSRRWRNSQFKMELYNDGRVSVSYSIALIR